MSKISTFIRTTFAMGDDIRDAGLTTPDDIVRYDDIAYGPDPKRQSLDVYRPKAEEGKKLPVIVSVHGGGWVYGDKNKILPHVFHCNIKSEDAKLCNDEECAFFKQFL